MGPVTGRAQGIAYSHQLKRWGIVSRGTTRAGRAQGIAPTMDGFRFTVVKRLCEPFCPPHHPITQICTLKLVPMGEHKASPIRTNLREGSDKARLNLT